MMEQAALFDLPQARTMMPHHWQGSARISRCGTYRCELRRWWRAGPPVAWLMLNPSTADGLHDDPTLRRIIGFTYRWGFGGLVVVNLYPFRASSAQTRPDGATPAARLPGRR